MADDESTAENTSLPNDGKRQLLTHQTPKGRTASNPAATSENTKLAYTPPVPAKGSSTQKVSDGHPGSSPASLSEKLAAISTLRESTPREENRRKRSWRDGDLAPSSLPEALSRVDRKLRMDALPQQTEEKESADEEVQIEDPNPGIFSEAFWFIFRFGRFVRGPMLRESRLLLIGILFFLALSMCAQTLEWVGPAFSATRTLFSPSVFSLLLALTVVPAVLFYTVSGWVLLRGMRNAASEVNPLFGLRVVVNAFLPLGMVQSVYLILNSVVFREAFWRGALPEWAAVWNLWVFPVCWAWSGFRLAQATCSLLPVSHSKKVLLKTGCLGAGLILGALLHPDVAAWFHQDAVREWSVHRKRFLEPGATLELEVFDRIEQNLPFHAVDLRSELILFRLQQRFRQDRMDLVLEDALWLDRISPPGSAMDDVAKGLTLFLRGRLDLAVSRWNSAVGKDPDCLPAHQWLALASVGNDVQEAEQHARVLMKKDPNVFHLYLLVRILDVQNKHAAIWEAMFDVEAPPEEWYPLTLLQGSRAAEELGKAKRAERLRTLAEARGFGPADAPDLTEE